MIQGMGLNDGIGSTIDNFQIFPYLFTHRVQVNNVCVCQPGYFDNGYSTICTSCQLISPYCSQCSFTANLTQLTPDCLNSLSPDVNCTFGQFMCSDCQSGYILVSGSCQQDNSQNAQTNLQYYKNTVVYRNCNGFQWYDTLAVGDFGSLVSLTASPQISISSQTLNPTPKSLKLHITGTYSQNIANRIITFNMYYLSTQNIVKYQKFDLDMRRSDIPLVMYHQGQCSAGDKVHGYLYFLASLAYLALLLSLGTFRLVAIELFGVFQVSFFKLAFFDRVDIFYSFFTQVRLFNGFNVPTYHSYKNLPASIVMLGYKDNIIFNINFMFALIFVNQIIGIVLYIISKVQENQKLLKISKYILNYVFITLLLFNSLNISFCIGLHFLYARQDSTQFYELGNFTIFLYFLMLLCAFGQLQWVKDKYFGEFKRSLKQDYLNRQYISFTLLYRISIGLFIAVQSQYSIATLIILGFSFTFLMFTLINLPFKRAHQNYRSNLCHITNLVALFSTNYYRSMKINMPIDQKAKIHWPAILQLILISVCTLTTIIYFIHVIAGKIKRRFMAKAQIKSVQNTRVEQNSTIKNLKSSIDQVGNLNSWNARQN